MQPITTFRDRFYVSRQNWRKKITNPLYGPCLILLYHRVTKTPSDPQLLAVSPENFYEQVKFLKKNFTMLDINEFVFLRKNSKRIPRNTVILTFDDGYADNFYEALPILEKLGAQALFYISTSMIDTEKEFWWDELEKIFMKENQALPKLLSLKIKEQVFEYTLNTCDSYSKIYTELHPIIKPLKPQLQEEVMSYLVQWSGANKSTRTTHRVMRKEEIKKMCKSRSAIIGAHTHCHPQLSALSYREQELEITTSKRILEEITADKINHFSYPYGTFSDYNSSSVSICQKLGFDIVCSNFPHLVMKESDNFNLPRFIVRDWTLDQFKTNMKAFLSTSK